MKGIIFGILILMMTLLSCRSNVKEEAMIIDNLQIQQDKVVQQLKQNVKDHPGVAENYAILAGHYMKEDEINEAIKILRIGIQKSDETSTLHDDLAEAYLMKKDTANAKQYLHDLEKAASSPEVNYLRSVHEYLKGQHAVAFDLVNKALAYDKGNAKYLLRKGIILLALEDTVGAIASLQTGINRENVSVEHFELLSEVLIQSGRLAEAASVLKRAINEYSENQQLRFNYARFLEAQTMTAKAKQLYLDFAGSALKPMANERLMQIYMNERNYDSLNMIIDQTLASDPRNTTALLYEARVEDRFRRYQNALSTYQEILSIDSSNTIAKEELDKLQRKMRYLQRLQQQEEEREKSKNIKPLNPI